MEQTRSSLAEKLEVLEQKVTNTEDEATSAVTDTVEAVKDTVESTVDSVRDTLDLTVQVERHPWAMVGGSVALGFLGGFLLGPASRGQARSAVTTGWEPEWDTEPPAASTPAPARRQASWWDQLRSTFGSEIDKLKGLALGTIGGVVRDLVSEEVPEPLRPAVTEMINNLTTKMGGETIQGRVIPEPQASEQARTPASTLSS